MNTRRLAAGVLLVALTATGCGGEGRGVSDSASAELNNFVDAIRTSAGARDRAAVEQQLELLRQAVEELRSQGELSAGAADRILAAATGVAARLASLPTTTTTSNAPPPPTIDDDEDDEDDGHGDDNGGHGGGDHRGPGGD